jgi:hypothetical protein
VLQRRAGDVHVVGGQLPLFLLLAPQAGRVRLGQYAAPHALRLSGRARRVVHRSAQRHVGQFARGALEQCRQLGVVLDPPPHVGVVADDGAFGWEELVVGHHGDDTAAQGAADGVEQARRAGQAQPESFADIEPTPAQRPGHRRLGTIRVGGANDLGGHGGVSLTIRDRR